MDSTGRRVDLDQRPELIKGSVEFIAPAEYMVRPPMPPLYFFLIDVSISAVQSGMLEVSVFYENKQLYRQGDFAFLMLINQLIFFCIIVSCVYN